MISNEPSIQLLTLVSLMLWKCLLLNEYLFPMQGHFVEYTVEFQALKLTVIPPIPWLYHSFDTRFCFPCAVWICFIHCVYYNVISSVPSLFLCFFPLLIISYVRSERLKDGEKILEVFVHHCVQPLILYSSFPC